jgi:hypothetical protein
MDVYLVPVGDERYELYCEAASGATVAQPDHRPGLWRGLVDRFRAVLATVEREDADGNPRHAPPGTIGRLRVRLLRWLAETVAEQRLLWHLRHETRATTVFPDDLSAEDAIGRIRRTLARERQRHAIWLGVNAVAFAGSGVLAPLPGPNVVAYYFAFRLVGHFLAMRGARHGLAGVVWDARPSDALTGIRVAAAMGSPERDRLVESLSARLGLGGLPRFFARTAVPAS